MTTPKRELALHHAATRAENRHPRCLGQLRGLVQQRTLADPGRSLDHHDPARAGCGGVQRIADLLQLRLALEQVGAPVQIRHPAPRDRRTAWPAPGLDSADAKRTPEARAEAGTCAGRRRKACGGSTLAKGPHRP